MKRKGQQRREEILRVAGEIIEEKGVEKLTVTLLAERMGLSLGAMYRYFSSLEELIIGLQSQALDEVLGEVVKGWQDYTTYEENTGKEPSEEVKGLCRVLVAIQCYVDAEHLKKQSFLLLERFLLSQDRILNDEQVMTVQRQVNGLVDAISVQMKIALSLDSDDQASQRTRIAWGSLVGLLSFRQYNPFWGDHLHARLLIRHAMHDLFRGWSIEEKRWTEATELFRTWCLIRNRSPLI